MNILPQQRRLWVNLVVGEILLLMWQAPRTADLVDRQLTATQPNQLWVSDFSVAYQERVGGELLLSPQSVEIIKLGDPGSGR